MSDLLHEELVSTFRSLNSALTQRCQAFMFIYIGLGVAVGRPVLIPVIIRTLAADFYLSAADGKPMTFDKDFSLYLDSLSFNKNLNLDDLTFLNSWWLEDSSPGADWILGDDNLFECLKHHASQTSRLYKIQMNTAQAAERVVLDTPMPGMAKPAYGWSRDISAPVPTQEPLLGPNPIQCTRCRLYRSVAVGAQDELQDILQMVDAMQQSFYIKFDTSMRRVAGFNLLHEVAVNKEAMTESGPTPIPKPGPTEQSTPRTMQSEVRTQALQEMKKLEISGSMKWTWGVDLSDSDLLDLVQGADWDNQISDLGYDQPHTTGSVVGSDLQEPGYHLASASNERFDVLSDDILPVPDLDVRDIPHHFTTHPLRRLGRTGPLSVFIRRAMTEMGKQTSRKKSKGKANHEAATAPFLASDSEDSLCQDIGKASVIWQRPHSDYVQHPAVPLTVPVHQVIVPYGR